MSAPTTTPRWPRRWPVAVISLPAAVATWSGWVGLGEMAAFGKVKLLPGLWDDLQLNTAITLPIGVEAYAAFAISAALTSAPVTKQTRRFAWASSVAALALGMGAQVAYHLLKNAGLTAAPWQITTFVSCLPVLVLGLGAVLAHMLHRDRTAAAVPFEDPIEDQTAPATPTMERAPDPVEAAPSGEDPIEDSSHPARDQWDLIWDLQDRLRPDEVPDDIFAQAIGIARRHFEQVGDHITNKDIRDRLQIAKGRADLIGRVLRNAHKMGPNLEVRIEDPATLLKPGPQPARAPALYTGPAEVEVAAELNGHRLTAPKGYHR